MCLAVIQKEQGDGALLAFSEAVHSEQTHHAITLLHVSPEGGTSEVFRVRCETQCLRLGFCHKDYSSLYSGHMDGLLVLYNLTSGTISCSNDDCDVSSLDISVDRTMFVSTSGNCLRVHKVAKHQSGTSLPKFMGL